ncbi:Versicolorin B desaturase [Madurella mycetomatis]|uniref:Versicolorin B desaturase n=1 Tax=Madurella mycetomatis TaxID=100816 RepID=A0A175WCB3_9PEZI|nr:Versicolorin B desaturase [Madurella mycetomatis]
MQGITYSIAVAGVVLMLLIVLSKAIYNVYFHPLSAYPGPWWMAVSDMVRLAHLASGRYVALNHRLHLLYGPVVRVGPKELSFIQPGAWKDIYGHSNNRAEFAKDPHFYGTTSNGVNYIGTADRQDHARMRSVFSRAFSERALRN